MKSSSFARRDCLAVDNAFALPTAAVFAHLPTACYYDSKRVSNSGSKSLRSKTQGGVLRLPRSV